MQGQYSIIRYVPDPKRGECVNLGIVLVSESEGTVCTCFRESSSFSDYPNFLKPDPKIVVSFENYLSEAPKEISKDKLGSFLINLQHDWQNSIQTSEPHVCSFGDPEKFVLSMFNELVVSGDRPKTLNYSKIER